MTMPGACDQRLALRFALTDTAQDGGAFNNPDSAFIPIHRHVEFHSSQSCEAWATDLDFLVLALTATPRLSRYTRFRRREEE